MEYVSPKYEKQLQDLAETLCTPERFGKIVLAEVVELHPIEQLQTA